MGSLLGFRQPQFSEEAAWLPAWLQPCIREASNEPFQCPSGQALEEIQCLQQSSMSTREHGNLSHDGRYKSFHLFLSGEENSSMHFPSCSSNHEVQFRLHLSLNEESENSLSPILNKSQAEIFDFNQALPVQQQDAEVIPEEGTCEVGYKADEVYMAQSQQKNNLELSGHESLVLEEEKRTKPEVDARSLKLNVDDAVELTVAASEALIIHKVVKKGPNTELWTSSEVLEAAILVKQARLEDVNKTSSSPIDENSDIDVLSDLDESAMADAYEDIGLTVGYESVISHVKDTYASESYMSDAKPKYNEPGDLEVCSGSNSMKQQHKEVNNARILLKRNTVLESSDGGTRKECANYAPLGSKNADVACDSEHMLSCSVEQPGFFTAEVGLLKEGFVRGDMTPPQKILRSSLPPGTSGYDEGEDKKTNLVPDRFQSRWFGGWTSKKEVNVPAVVDHKYAGTIPELFVNETSSLSESADIAPDQNSCIHKQDKECQIVSRSSIAPEGTYEKASNNGNLLSEDVAVSPSVSPVDPLCSIVPCSITSDTARHCSVVAQNRKHQVNHQKDFSPTAEANLDNPKRVSPQSTDFLHGKERSISIVSGESSHAVHRQVASLKTYSMLYPRGDPYLGKGLTHGESLSLKHAPDMHPGLGSPVVNFRDEINDHNKTAKGDMEFPGCMERETNLPMTINHGIASICLSLDIDRDENPDLTGVQENNVELQVTKAVDKLQSNHKSYLVPRRKRVCFSEAEISFPQVKKFQTLQTRVESSVASRMCERLGSSNRHLKTRAREVERRRAMDNKMLFQNLKFLLTGFSVKKDKCIKSLIWEGGGVVLDDIPSPPTSRGKRCSRYKSQRLPLILCPKRLLTTKFLYGCAVDACILKVKWLFDSIDEGSILPPKKYIILKEHASQNCMVKGKLRCTYFIFDNVGIVLHGKHNFCTKMASVIKHGGGLVFKTLHWLIKSLNSKKVSLGAIVVEDETTVSRQLKQCALEQKIPMMPLNWIVNSLYAGRLLLSPEYKHSSASLLSRLPDRPVYAELSEEI